MYTFSLESVKICTKRYKKSTPINFDLISCTKIFLPSGNFLLLLPAAFYYCSMYYFTTKIGKTLRTSKFTDCCFALSEVHLEFIHTFYTLSWYTLCTIEPANNSHKKYTEKKTNWLMNWFWYSSIKRKHKSKRFCR